MLGGRLTGRSSRLYGRLLRAGIEVWEYIPAMMHAKLAIADETPSSDHLLPEGVS